MVMIAVAAEVKIKPNIEMGVVDVVPPNDEHKTGAIVVSGSLTIVPQKGVEQRYMI